MTWELKPNIIVYRVNARAFVNVTSSTVLNGLVNEWAWERDRVIAAEKTDSREEEKSRTSVKSG